MSMASRMPFDRSSSFGAGSFGIRKFRKIDSFSHSALRVRQDRREEAVGAGERLGLALEVDLPVLVELVLVDGHAGIEDRVELVAVGAAEVQLDELRRPAPASRPAQPSSVGLQVVQLVRVGLLAEDRRAVVVGEGVRRSSRCRSWKSSTKHVVLLRMRPVQARERLHGLDAGERLVHVHRVQQRLVVAGLELVGADQEAIRVFLNLVGDLAAREAVERRLASPSRRRTRARRRRRRWPGTGSCAPSR